MVEVGYFNVMDRRREKQEARDRDEHLIASGQVEPQEIAQRNGLFSASIPHKFGLCNDALKSVWHE